MKHLLMSYAFVFSVIVTAEPMFGRPLSLWVILVASSCGLWIGLKQAIRLVEEDVEREVKQ